MKLTTGFCWATSYRMLQLLCTSRARKALRASLNKLRCSFCCQLWQELGGLIAVVFPKSRWPTWSFFYRLVSSSTHIGDFIRPRVTTRLSQSSQGISLFQRWLPLSYSIQASTSSPAISRPDPYFSLSNFSLKSLSWCLSCCS